MKFHGLVLLVFYLIILLAIGIYAHLRSKRNVEDFFVASRSLGPFVLFMTMAATNFSAFTFFGFAGASYRTGYAYYGMMAVGTAFMAISFYVIGRKVWRLGKEKGYITPPELVGDILGSEGSRLLFLAIMVVFTIPYLATQAVGGGIAITGLTDGAVPYEVGAMIVTGIIMIYVLLGGMRGDALTDVLQGIVMVVTVIAAVGVVAWGLGGFGSAFDAVKASRPDLLGKGGFTWQTWTSYLILWSAADPMFPQLFTRFYSARDEKALRTSMVLYPLVVALLFLGPVLIGVWGNLDFPGLTSSEADSILPMMVSLHGPGILTSIVLTGAFAAIMSTADSQLLVMSSMLTRDVYSRWIRPKSSGKEEYMVGRILVVLLSLVGLAIALFRVDSIFDILTKTTFTGLAVLFPTTIAVLYWKGTTKWGCITSIILGELTYAMFYFGWLPERFTFGFLPVVPSLLVASLSLVTVSLLTRRRTAVEGKTLS